MLVLTRKENERILIGDDIEVVVIAVQGQRVKLGIQAPNDLRIERLEVTGRVHRQRPIAFGCLSR